MAVSLPFSFLHGETDPGPSVSPVQDHVRYLGAPTCLSSMCHGGASPSRDQFTIWSHQDFHSRAYATLITARSVQIAAGLGITTASESARCTVCHAPLANVTPGYLASTASVTEGVSCENCHNSAAAWIRSHTRPDFSYADRLQAGLRNLRSAYVRAETCVACHQVIDPALVKAGHPELTFELDGMTASEPRHWSEKDDWSGPKAWLVGQVVALREISKEQSKNPDDILTAQRKALSWLLYNVPIVQTKMEMGTNASDLDHPTVSAAWGNEMAQIISRVEWSPAMSAETLTALAGTSAAFTDNTVTISERERRAERLVLGLDRLFKATHPAPNAPGQAELAALFELVQDPNHFDAPTFAQRLQKFADALKR